MNAIATPQMDSTELKRAIIDFARGASIEISTHDEALLPELAKSLLPGTTVYVAHTPKASLDDVVRVAVKAQAAGFRASPHIIARRLVDARALRGALRALHEGGVRQVLVVAGDLKDPAGEFSSTPQVLETGILLEEGMERIGVGAHPEGHPVVAPAALWQALKEKQSFVDRTGAKLHLVTQFGFNPETVFAWYRRLTEHGISLPVHVGIAGPTPLPKLIKFAMQCGVGNSLNSLMKNMGAMSNLARSATSPDEMLAGLVQGRAAHGASRVLQPHLFCFGGSVPTAQWLRSVIDGAFELPIGGGKFIIRG